MEHNISQQNPNSSEFPTLSIDHNFPVQVEFPTKKDEEDGKNDKNSLTDAVELEIEMEKRKIREETIASKISRRRELEAEVRMELMMEEKEKFLSMRRSCNDPYMLMNNNNYYNNVAFSGFRYGSSYFGKNLMNLGCSNKDMNLISNSSSGVDDFVQVKLDPLQNVCDDVIRIDPFSSIPNALSISTFSLPGRRLSKVESPRSSWETMRSDCKMSFGQDNSVQPIISKGLEIIPKMGYTPGTGLGKDGAGMKEPIPVVDKKDRHGLGYRGNKDHLPLKKFPLTLNGQFVLQGDEELYQSCGEEVLGQAMPKSSTSSMKRKAETSIVAGDEETASVAGEELQKKKFYCSLCGVSATSSGGLNLHLHGKKHKAKEAISKSSDMANSISMDSRPVENSMQPVVQAESQVQPVEVEKSQVQPMETEKSLLQHVEEEKSKVQPMEEEKNQVQSMEFKKKQVTKKWECSLCQLTVTSEVLLNSHLQGKKHKTKEAISKSSDMVGSISMDNRSVENSMQPVVQAESQVQPVEEEKSQVQPMEEEKCLAEHVEEEKSQVHPMEEEKNQVQPMEQEKRQVTKKWECSLCQLNVTSEVLFNSHLQGKKHKAKEANLGVGQGMSNNHGETAKAKGEDVMKWYCSICQVAASSEKNLNDHFQGKKHKAKAGSVHQEADNVDSDSVDKISNDVQIVSEKSFKEEEGLKNEPENLSVNMDPGKGQSCEQEIVNTLDTANIGLERNEAETEEMENSGDHSQEADRKRVKLWHCKMCNEGTYDEATMANHRKSSKHMNLLRKIGGGLIVVSNVPMEAVEG